MISSILAWLLQIYNLKVGFKQLSGRVSNKTTVLHRGQCKSECFPSMTRVHLYGSAVHCTPCTLVTLLCVIILINYMYFILKSQLYFKRCSSCFNIISPSSSTNGVWSVVMEIDDNSNPRPCFGQTAVSRTKNELLKSVNGVVYNKYPSSLQCPHKAKKWINKNKIKLPLICNESFSSNLFS